MKLFVRIARRHHIKTIHDPSEWLWHFIDMWWTPLEYAASYGHLHILRYLHDNGADIRNGYVLERASRWGCYSIVCYLHENGVDIHANDEYALRHAAYYGRFEVVKYLVQHGADIQHAINIALKNGEFYTLENLKMYLRSMRMTAK